MTKAKRPDAAATAAPTDASAASAVVERMTKASSVVALLKRPDGASIDDIMAATGWQAHTTRAMLTGLRKTHSVVKSGERGCSRYRIEVAQ